MYITCKKCGREWTSRSEKHRICCPGCRTSITPVHVVRTKKPLELPVSLIDTLAFRRSVSWAKTNGQMSIPMNINSEGVLSLA